MQNEGLSLESIVILGTTGMIILAMGVVVFFIIYQKRLADKENQIAFQRLEHQKSLIDAVIRTREIEQRRIALELHDDVGSTLTAIKFSIPNLNVAPENKEKLLDTLQSAIQKVRRISNDLLPSVLDELGLKIAVKSLLQTLNDSTTVNFSLNVDNTEIRQPKDVELVFYRVLQELLNNIIKYAEATSVNVELLIDSQQVVMIVKDDGTGFTPADHANKENPTLGLRNMESRVQQINGRISYKKLPEKGTSVTVNWKTTDRK